MAKKKAAAEKPAAARKAGRPPKKKPGPVPSGVEIRQEVSETSYRALAVLKQRLELEGKDCEMESWTKAFKIVADQIRRDHKVPGEKGFAEASGFRLQAEGGAGEGERPKGIQDLRLAIVSEDEEGAA